MKYPKKIKLPNGKFAKVQSEIEEKILLEEILKSEQLKQERDDVINYPNQVLGQIQ